MIGKSAAASLRFADWPIVDLAHDLGLGVIAEGVEDNPTWDVLAALGCDMAQGYYFSRPLPATDVIAWIETSRHVAPRLAA